MSVDPRTLADRLDREADLIDSAGQRHRPHADDLRTAAVLLRDLADLHYLSGYHDAMMKAARMILAAPTSTHGSRQCDGPGAIPRVADHATSADGDPQHVWNTYALRDFALSLIDRELEALGFADPNEDTHDD